MFSYPDTERAVSFVRVLPQMGQVWGADVSAEPLCRTEQNRTAILMFVDIEPGGPGLHGNWNYGLHRIGLTQQLVVKGHFNVKHYLLGTLFHYTSATLLVFLL